MAEVLPLGDERLLQGRNSDSLSRSVVKRLEQRLNFESQVLCRGHDPGSVAARPSYAVQPLKVTNVAGHRMESAGAFITDCNFLMDGGVTASYWSESLLQQ